MALVTDGKTPPRDRRAMIAALMEAHGDAVFGFCLRMVADRHLAEDIKQQVFLEAFRDLDGFERRSSPRSWLFGITSHRYLDAIKTQQRRSKLIESDEQAVLEFEAPAVDPIELLDHPRVMAALEGCLKRLSPDMRATVLMRFLTELTYEEMAVLLEVSADTLQVRVSRALRILRQCLEKKGWTGE